MKVAHLRRRLHVSANPGARQIAPVTVVAGAYVENDEVAVADDPVGCETPVWSGIRARTDDVGALRPLAAHRCHHFPGDGQNFTFLDPRAQKLEGTIERRLGDRIRSLEAQNVVLGLDYLRRHEHPLIPIGECGLRKYFADGRLHINIPDVDADSLPGE